MGGVVIIGDRCRMSYQSGHRGSAQEVGRVVLLGTRTVGYRDGETLPRVLGGTRLPPWHPCGSWVRRNAVRMSGLVCE